MHESIPLSTLSMNEILKQQDSWNTSYTQSIDNTKATVQGKQNHENPHKVRDIM